METTGGNLAGVTCTTEKCGSEARLARESYDAWWELAVLCDYETDLLLTTSWKFGFASFARSAEASYVVTNLKIVFLPPHPQAVMQCMLHCTGSEGLTLWHLQWRQEGQGWSE